MTKPSLREKILKRLDKKLVCHCGHTKHKHTHSDEGRMDHWCTVCQRWHPEEYKNTIVELLLDEIIELEKAIDVLEKDTA